jgi:hypothetical protein
MNVIPDVNFDEIVFPANRDESEDEQDDSNDARDDMIID